MSNAPLVICFCNVGYIPVLANFFAAPGAPNPASVRIYALDRQAADFAQSAGAEVEQLNWSSNLGKLWKPRIDIFRSLVDEGQDFVHTDSDAVWRRDATVTCIDGSRDMSFSQGSIFPAQVLDVTGFVLCCGLFRMNATEGTKAFLAKVDRDIAETGDDQMSVNRVLLEAGTRWEECKTADYRLRFNGHSFSCWKTSRVGKSEEFGLEVELIPHGLVQRIHDPVGAPRKICVQHPLAPKEAGEKLDLFRKMGLLYIREDWRGVPPGAGMDAYRSALDDQTSPQN